MILKNNHNEMKISNLIIFIDNNTYLIKCSMHGSCLAKGKKIRFYILWILLFLFLDELGHDFFFIFITK